MPYAFDETGGLMRVTLHGAVTGKELHRIIDEGEAILKARQQWPDGLVDLRAMDVSGLGFFDLVSLPGRKPAVTPPHGVRVAVVSDSQTIVGAVRIFGKHPSLTVELFSTLDAAEAWLAGPRT